MSHLTTDWKSRLNSLGFRKLKTSSRYKRQRLYVASQPSWWTLSARPKEETDLLRGFIGRPGLWKPVKQSGGKQMLEFHPPAAAVSGEKFDFEEDGQGDPLTACVNWAEATLEGKIPDGWKPPERKQLEDWLGDKGLTVQSGSLIRQGELICEPDRLAVVFPIVHQLPDDLSPNRRRWLEAVLTDAQNRWRMVRVGFAGKEETDADHGQQGDKHSSGSPAICAEVDLTGAPEAALESVWKTGVDGLRWVVAWLLWPAGFVCDPSVTCSVWDLSPERAFGP